MEKTEGNCEVSANRVKIVRQRVNTRYAYEKTGKHFVSKIAQHLSNGWLVRAAAIKTIDVEESMYEVLLTKEEGVETNEDLFIALREIEFSTRVHNCIKNSDMYYVGDLIQRTEVELKATKNFGLKSLKEIKEVLWDMNLRLGMEVEEWPQRLERWRFMRSRQGIELE